MLLATIGTNEDLCPCSGEPSIIFGGHILNPFINKVQIHFMASGKSCLGKPMHGRCAYM